MSTADIVSRSSLDSVRFGIGVSQMSASSPAWRRCVRSASGRRAAAKCRRPECRSRRPRPSLCVRSARGSRSSLGFPTYDCATGERPARPLRRPAAPLLRRDSRASRSRSSAPGLRPGSAPGRTPVWRAASGRRDWRAGAKVWGRASPCLGERERAPAECEERQSETERQ